MASHDRFGSPFPGAPGPALEAWNAAMHGILVHGGQVAAALARAREAEPDCALVGAVQGLVLLIAGRAELVAPAQACAERIGAAARQEPLDRRSEAYASALSAWLDGSASRAAAILDAWHEREGCDALAVKLAHQLRFMAGDVVGMARSAERALARMPAAHPARGYVLGCVAFAREELGGFAAAERAGREAVERNGDDVWAIHAVAHVHEMTARPDPGSRWLEARKPGWIGCGNMRFHLWWHLALFALERGDRERALALYDGVIRAERTDDYRDVANAVSLLARLELAGVDVGPRWHELAALAARRVEDDSVVFARLHYLLALLRAGRPADAAALVAALRRAALRGGGDMDRVSRQPGLALAKALAAFDRGRYGDAAELFEAASGRLAQLGGSVAQRDLFERFAIEAALRAGRPGHAEALLVRRRARRGGAVDSFAADRLRAIDRAGGARPGSAMPPGAMRRGGARADRAQPLIA